MIRNLFAGALALVVASCSLSPASASNLPVKDANGTTQYLCEKTASDGSLIACHVVVDTSGSQIDPATKQLQQSEITALGSPFQAGGLIGNTSFGAKLLDSTGASFGTSGNPVYVTGIAGGGGGGGAVTAASGAYAAGAIVDLGTGATPGAQTVNGRLASINTTLGTPLQAGGLIGNTAFGISGTLPAFASTPTVNLGTLNGAATAANQASMIAVLGAPAQLGGKIDTVINGAVTDYGALVGTTAVTLIPANATRRGYSIQIQTPGVTCYFSGTGTATQDFHSTMLVSPSSANGGGGAYFESKESHVGTNAISMICSAANTSIAAKAW